MDGDASFEFDRRPRIGRPLEGIDVVAPEIPFDGVYRRRDAAVDP